MGSVYDIVTATCFACVVVIYFMFTDGGTKVLAHFMPPAAAFANAGMNVPAVISDRSGHGLYLHNCSPLRMPGGAVSQPQTCE